jgi:hypothetical protein
MQQPSVTEINLGKSQHTIMQYCELNVVVLASHGASRVQASVHWLIWQINLQAGEEQAEIRG